MYSVMVVRENVHLRDNLLQWLIVPVRIILNERVLVQFINRAE